MQGYKNQYKYCMIPYFPEYKYFITPISLIICTA